MAFDGLTERQVALQRLTLQAPPALRELYWRSSGSPACDQNGIALPAGCDISTHTYFGAFYEQHWRTATRLRRVGLRLDIRGAARLRLMRWAMHTGAVVAHEAQVDGPVQVLLPDDAGHWRQAGLLWFELVAGEGGAVLRSAAWTAPGASPDTVALGVAICTFNREAALGRVLDAIADATALAGAVARVVVVNQGRPGLVAHPEIAAAAAALGDRLRVVEQGNFGGAGGFGRGLIELIDDPAVTHAVFLDDDIRLEPESLARMHAFFSLAARDFALGGNMLDAMNPGMLYEAGATLGPTWWMEPSAHMQDLRGPQVLNDLLALGPVHYNGWWCFGFPKRFAAEHGMMLPCFIRGDDVEYGLRLHHRGIPTLGLPGVAVWHEPFYLKLGGWQLYYETRNMLTWAALHLDWGRRAAAMRVAKHFVAHLLTYRYYSAALILRGVQDWLSGPAILDRDPRPLHATLAELKDRYPEPATPRTRVLAPAAVGRRPRQRQWAMASSLLRNLLRPTAEAAPAALPVTELVWYAVAPNEAVAVETHWDQALPTFRRDRAAFRALSVAGVRALWRLYREAPALQAAWRREAPRLASEAYWRRYLGLDGQAALAAARTEGHH